MAKSIHRPEGQILVELLREYREASGLTQTELSRKLGRAQSYISDVERGQRRLDLVQLRDTVQALGFTLSALVSEFDKRVERSAKQGRR